MSGNLPAVRAERDRNRGLALTRKGARREQPRHVQRADEQQQHRCGEENPSTSAQPPAPVLTERLAARAQTSVDVGVLPCDFLEVRADLLLRDGSRYAWTQTSEDPRFAFSTFGDEPDGLGLWEG